MRQRSAGLRPLEWHVEVAQELRAAVEAGRHAEAVARALQSLEDEPSARQANLVAAVANAAGDPEAQLLAIAVAVALDEPNAAVLRRLAVLLARRGLAGLAESVMSRSWDIRVRDLRRSGKPGSADLRQEYFAALRHAAQGAPPGRPLDDDPLGTP